MRRLPAVRFLVAGLAALLGGSLVAGGLVVGCSSGPGTAYADGAARSVIRTLPGNGGAAGASAQAGDALLPNASPTPTPTASPEIVVSGAPQGVRAKTGVLADAATGQVLWSQGLNAERPMASITKVMTAYLVINAGDLDRKVTIPKGVLNYVVKYGASSDDLKPGEVLTVRELLYGLLLESGADAAYTLASTYGPGIGAFVAQMNATATQLGMLHTHFTSPDGLPYPTETSTYSTPADLLVLGEAAMKSALFRSIVDQRYYSLPKGDGHAAHWWGNSNDLIGHYQGAIGIKTGYTDVALHCLLFEAVRGNRDLIGVVLGSPATGPASGAQDAAKLLNWGFALKPTQ
jgi:D-alanyl-D-alanine carboxypeptidase (penicillin-binding protein 5/6)